MSLFPIALTFPRLISGVRGSWHLAVRVCWALLSCDSVGHSGSLDNNISWDGMGRRNPLTHWNCWHDPERDPRGASWGGRRRIKIPKPFSGGCSLWLGAWSCPGRSLVPISQAPKSRGSQVGLDAMVGVSGVAGRWK